MNALAQFGTLPVDFSTLASAFPNLRSPGEKIAALEKQGRVIRLKKGLFVVTPEDGQPPLSAELIANHLLGPSYVSLETALAFHGIIPEAVRVTRSVCLKRGREFATPLGHFDYTRVAPDYFPIGIRRHDAGGGQAFLIASPEKALCDMLVATSNLRLQSANAARAYFEENLRVDFSAIEHPDVGIVRACAAAGSKQNSLRQLAKILPT